MIRHVLASTSLALLALAGCGNDTPAPADDVTPVPVVEDVASPAPAEPEPSAEPGDLPDTAPTRVMGEPITITDVQNGDIACYVITERDEALMAVFDLCDEALIGTQQVPTYEDRQVMSPACEGDVDCELTVTESIIVALSPVE